MFLLTPSPLFAFELISSAEHSQFLGHRVDKPKPVLVRSFFPSNAQDLPDISVLKPFMGKDILSPTHITMTFRAQNQATIDVSSLKFLYGWLGLDITDRIKENAVITATGLSAKNVTLPKGEHVIIVKISDSLGRMAEKEIEFTIK